jgi:TRAP-type mannitol/chloroaromatic compound transport system permease small subunit
VFEYVYFPFGSREDFYIRKGFVRQMRRFVSIIDSVSDWTALPLSLLVVVLMVILLAEVFLRYVLHNPLVWSYEVSQQVFAAYAVLGGGYVLLHRSHIRIDVLFNHFSPRRQAIIESITFLLFFLFVGSMLVFGLRSAVNSVVVGEVGITPFRIPLYTIRFALVIGALLMLLQGIAQFTRSVYFAISGSPLE